MGRTIKRKDEPESGPCCCCVGGEDSAGRVANENDGSRTAELPVHRWDQLLFKKVEKSVAAFTLAASADRQSRWCEIPKPVRIRNSDDDRFGNVTEARELRHHRH